MHFDGDNEKKREFLRYGILAFERLKISEKLESIDNDDLISDLLSFGEVFADLQEIEASLYWEIANERVKVIRSLADSCDTNAKEKVLQKKLCKRRQAIVKETGANQGAAQTGHSPT